VQSSQSSAPASSRIRIDLRQGAQRRAVDLHLAVLEDGAVEEIAEARLARLIGVDRRDYSEYPCSPCSVLSRPSLSSALATRKPTTLSMILSSPKVTAAA
jgi:hypothetical protein